VSQGDETYESFANAGRYQKFIPGRCHRHPTHLDRNRSTKMKNYDFLTESRMLSALLVVAAAVFEYYRIVELLLK
jgi:hypothetical protein